MTTHECFEAATAQDKEGQVGLMAVQVCQARAQDPSDWVQTSMGGMHRWQAVIYDILLCSQIRAQVEFQVSGGVG